MTENPIERDGSTLILGPSNVGKTRLTARALTNWLSEEGPEGVVVFEFGPEFERDGRLLGRRLDRFLDVPDGVWHGVLAARAPRAESDSSEAALELARVNATRAATLFDRAPDDPTAVFVNDATIPFQASGDPARVTDYCDGVRCAVLNALESDELGTDDPVSQNERRTIERLEAWADRTRRLTETD